MAMKDLRVIRVGEVGINYLSMELLLCIGRRGIAASAGGGAEWRGRGTIVNSLLEDCARSNMIIDISRQQYRGI
jgi:hypothetical protein